MDTRQKIVELSSLRALVADGNWIAVAGFFDPLTLVQAERLAALKQDGRKLLAVVSSHPDTLLTSEARAALVAALRSVDAVVIASADEVRSSCGLAVDDDPAADLRRSADFVNFVFER